MAPVGTHCFPGLAASARSGAPNSFCNPHLCLMIASCRLAMHCAWLDCWNQLNANSLARCAAFTTALIRVTRSLPSSSSMMASMVQPAGVVTASLRRAG